MPISVLVVDDEITLRHVLVLQLDKLGYKADSAANGIEALRRVHNHCYGLIIMDLQMPEMDGYEAAGAIRAYERGQQNEKPVPIVGMSAALDVDAERCIAAGMNDFVQKPILRENLKALVEKWLPEQPADHRAFPAEAGG